MTTDPYTSYSPNLTGPAYAHFAITPSDSTELASRPRAIYVGGAGNLALTVGGVSITYAVQAGAILPIRPEKVLSTGTTATGIVGWY